MKNRRGSEMSHMGVLAVQTPERQQVLKSKWRQTMNKQIKNRQWKNRTRQGGVPKERMTEEKVVGNQRSAGG